MEFIRPGAALIALAGCSLLLGTARYGATTVPHSTAALRAALAEPCAERYVAPRPLDRRFETTFHDVIGASATVKVYVDAEGRVKAADIVSASDDVTGATALDVLRSQRFIPARCGSEPQPGLFIARFN
jgi:hypothetical protein